MHASHSPPCNQELSTCYFWSGEQLRSRCVSNLVFSSEVHLPPLLARLLADWRRDVSLHLRLQPGDVEELSLVRARTRWPGYDQCVQVVADWTRAFGLHEVLRSSDVSLMACRGARYHFDAAYYGGMAFCNLFLSEDCGLDLYFPATGHRIPLLRGTVVIFDTGQPHGVVARGSNDFKVSDFPNDQELTQIFLTWEFPIEQLEVAQLLQIIFDTDPATALLMKEEQLWVNGVQARVCPNSGQWRHAG